METNLFPKKKKKKKKKKTNIVLKLVAQKSEVKDHVNINLT